MRSKYFFKFYSLAILFVLVIPVHAQKIGFLLDSYVTERWSMDHKLFVEKVESLGGKAQVEIAYGDPAEQLRLGKKMIVEGAKVLVVVAVDAHLAAEIAVEAKKANVPIIAYDRLILSQDVTIYISYNNERVGELQAQYAVNKVPSGNYLVLTGPASDNNALLVRKGQFKILQPLIDNGKIKIIGDLRMDDWGEIGALLKVDQFLSANKEKPAAIVASNDALAGGTIQALPKDLRGKIIVTGQDADLSALRFILAGSQSMTVYKPIKPLAYLAAETAIKLAKKEAVNGKTKLKDGNIEVEAILLDPVTVDKTNIEETVVKDGHVSHATLMDKK